MLQKNIKEIRQQVVDDLRSSLPPGTYNLSVEQVALILHCKPGHIRNQISDEVFPIETIKIGRNRLVPFSCLADYQVEQILAQNKSCIGRPTKSARRIRGLMKGEAI